MSEIKRFANAQVDGKERRASRKIPRNYPLSSRWVKVEGAKACADSTWFIQVLGKAGPLREERVAVRILTGDDVEGSARPRDDERVQLYSPASVDRALDEKAVPHVSQRSSPLRTQIV